MIKIWISYFYQLRKFPENLIPFSTAHYDPKWFHNFQGQNKVFIDDRGVINGLRLPQLSFPKDLYQGLEERGMGCSKDCILQHKVSLQLEQNKLKNTWQKFGCKFMDLYFKYLWDNVNYDDLMNFFKITKEKYEELKDLDDVEFVLLVHEPPSNPCAERPVLKRWFAEFGYDLEEWQPYE